MAAHEFAGQPVPEALRTNIPELMAAYYTRHPDLEDSSQRVSFGTSGHRGSSLDTSFNEQHIIAVTQAICEYRVEEGINGPLFLGVDTHALSEAARASALCVLAANDVHVMIQDGGGYTPTPVVSHAILNYNFDRAEGLADGIIITPSHNPPRDGGFKYNPPSGGPAGTRITKQVQDRANELIENGLKGVRCTTLSKALAANTTHRHDYIRPYVNDLHNVVNMEAIKSAGLKIGVDPMGGAGIDFWEPIAETYGIDLDVVNRVIDPAFMFMRVDTDGVVRMDCSSPDAMAGLINLKDEFDVAFGNDPDYDRHGIVTKSGLMNPNHYLAVCIDYLYQNRPGWRDDAAVGKTLVSSSMIDRVANRLGRRLAEVPVGFKWFVDGLVDGSYGFGGEESAGASFLRLNGTVWTTDKDGIILDLLAAEITAETGKDPSQHYEDLKREFGDPVYARINAPASLEEKAVLKNLSAEMVTADTLAGEAITQKLTHAPANGAAIGGLKVVTDNGWFAARPSGTENIYKIYAESFIGAEHLSCIQEEAQSIVNESLAAGVS